MTAAAGGAEQEAELGRYGELIARARASLGDLTTERLDRIRALLEQVLEAERPDRAALAELERALGGGA